jgi:hypothetical protein
VRRLLGHLPDGGIYGNATDPSAITSAGRFGCALSDLVFTSVLVASPCAGDCDRGRAVTVDELITLVEITLGNAEPSTCANGVPSGTEVDIGLIIQAGKDGCRRLFGDGQDCIRSR